MPKAREAAPGLSFALCVSASTEPGGKPCVGRLAMTVRFLHNHGPDRRSVPVSVTNSHPAAPAARFAILGSQPTPKVSAQSIKIGIGWKRRDHEYHCRR